MAEQTRPGEVLANRYLLVDLLNESRGGRFWRAHDRVLARHVAVHVIPESDERAPLLLEAARLSATVSDPRILRVLDADQRDGVCYVVNQWGAGQSLDLLLAEGPMLPRRAAWIVSEVAEMLANAHAGHVAHGRLVPENVLIDHNGTVKVIGFAVDAALHGLPAERFSTDVVDLAGLLYAAMVGKWPGISHSGLPPAPQDDGRVLRPRKVRAGIPKVLDTLCDEVICPPAADALPSDYASAAAICAALKDYVGDGEALAAAEAAQAPEPRFRTVPVPPRAAPGGAPSEGPADGDPAEGDPHHDGETDSDEPRTRVQPAVADPDATQASLPDLEKTENLSWFAPREEPPPPPPPFETPAERPLYAPDQTRRPRVPQQHDATAGNGDFWPWDAGQPPPPPVPERTPERVPGRSWLWPWSSPTPWAGAVTAPRSPGSRARAPARRRRW